MVKYSFIIGYRNRDLKRVKNSMDSIARQDGQNFEVVFVNYGSDEQITSEIEHLVKNYSFCKYIYSETRGMVWSRAHALNIGLKSASGDYVIFSDIDLLFPAIFTELLTLFLSDRTFLTHRCYYLPQGFELNSECNGKFDDIPSSYVGLLAVKREHSLKINGFDEFYQIWGAEDDDFIERLERAGLQRRIIDVSDIPIWHQWHPVASPKKPTPWYLAEVNYLYFYKSLSLENTNYGKILTIEDRPALNAYLNSFYKDSTELKISRNDHLAFLEFYQGFLQLKAGEMCFLEYENTELIYDKGKMKGVVDLINSFFNKIEKFHYRLIRDEKFKLSRLISFSDVKEFIEYFIGTNGKLIADYCFFASEDDLVLIVKKR